jgi:Uma2 family endonuclease
MEEEEGVGTDTMGLFSRSAGKPATPLDDFLRRYGKDTERELLDGAAVERMAVSLEHEKLRVWLEWLLKEYLKATRYGLLLDINTLVAINERRARRPDLAFLSEGSRELLKGNAVYGAPDLIIEITSAYDLASDLTSRENDYRSIGVPEIAFLDPIKRQARLLRLRGHEYETEMLLDAGTLQFAMLYGITIPLSALMYEPRPPVEEMVRGLLNPQ